MDFLSKPIGVRIMEKFKIYVHHNYSYERFWYFFHGVDVDINDVVTHTNGDNAFNKKIPITDKVNIKCKYKERILNIKFVGDSDWNLEGEHIFDYSIFLYDKKMASDRGFNSNIMEIIDDELIPKFNKLSKNVKSKYHFIYIKWEGHHGYNHHKMSDTLNYNINVYGDDFPIHTNPKNYFFLFTNTFISFIYPNTLGLREFYFMEKFIKNLKFKHKMNFPIRRLYGTKIKLYEQIKSLKNINVTHSSFHDTKQYSNDQVGGYRSKMINELGKENIIEKRGYGIDDWGGEWNDSNINEMMFKLYNIADVNIIPEYSPNEALNKVIKEKSKKKIPTIGTSFITEKSVSHILIGKPFIPISYETVEFYEKMMLHNNVEFKKYPLTYSHIRDIIQDLNTIADDEVLWKKLVFELQEWVSDMRKNIIQLIQTKNDLLEVVLNNNKIKETSNII